MTIDVTPISALETRAVTLAYDGPAVVSGLDLSIPAGKITALIGPNGCGKSTLLRGLARLMKPRDGAVYLDGGLIAKLPTREVARRLGILPQAPSAPEGLTVGDLVAQGRYPHQCWFQQWSKEDARMVEQALITTGLTEMADRPLEKLSGGQRQRAWIAMALAQGTSILLLDEPTTFLDLSHQLDVLHLLRHLNEEDGRTVVLVIHDLNHAARFAHHLVAMSEGRIVVEGSPEEVMTPRVLHDVFGVDAEIVPDPRTGAPLCVAYAMPASRHTAVPA
jgi:iron complex transport system ATP-binding protein